MGRDAATGRTLYTTSVNKAEIACPKGRRRAALTAVAETMFRGIALEGVDAPRSSAFIVAGIVYGSKLLIWTPSRCSRHHAKVDEDEAAAAKSRHIG